MNSNEGQPAETDIQEKYEATVLDFLDREMATVQEKQKNQQSDELDALVSDLLKQVITEADQPPVNDKPLFDEDELFSGLTSAQKQAHETGPDDKTIEDKPADISQSSSPAKPVEQPEVRNPKPEPAREVKAPVAPAAVFSPSVAPAKKFPVKIAAIAAGILVVIGSAAYLLTGSSSKAPAGPEPQAAITQAVKPAVQSAPSTVQPAGKTAPESVEPLKKPAAGTTPSSKPGANQATAQKQVKPAQANAKADPTPIATPKAPVEDRPAVLAQPVPVAPVPTQIAATVIEKQPTAIEHAPVTPSVPERKPTPSPQTASASEPPAPAPQPAAPAAMANRLVAAVPVMQASPVYPELALRAKASGSVVLELQIDDQGKVIKATPVSGPAIFHNAAIAAVMKWHYKPASIGGVNVSSQSRVTMAFNLKK